MANVTIPADCTTTQSGPLVKAVGNVAIVMPLTPIVVLVPPAGTLAGSGAPTVGQLFPIGNR